MIEWVNQTTFWAHQIPILLCRCPIYCRREIMPRIFCPLFMGFSPWYSGSFFRVFERFSLLVGGLEHFFSIYWEFHHPNWRTHIFQRGGSTTNQLGFSLKNGSGSQSFFGCRLSPFHPGALMWVVTQICWRKRTEHDIQWPWMWVICSDLW